MKSFPSLIILCLLSAFPAVFCSVVDAQEEPELQADAPDLEITSLQLTERSDTVLKYKFAIRNAGSQPLPAGHGVWVQALFSPNQQEGEGAKSAGNRIAGICKELQPGEECWSTGHAWHADGDFKFLLLKIWLKPDNGMVKPATREIGFENNLRAVAIDSPFSKLEQPIQGRTGERPASIRGNQSSGQKQEQRNAGKQESFFSKYFVFIAAALIGGISLVSMLVTWLLSKTSKSNASGRFQSAGKNEKTDPKSLQEIADKLRFKVEPELPASIYMSLESVLGFDEVTDVLQRPIKGGVLTLCNVRQEVEHHSSGSDSNSSSSTEIRYYTALLFTSDEDIYFPPFNVSPKRGLTGKFAKLFAGRYFGQVQFAEDPEFDQKVLVGTAVPEAVTPLLSSPVRNILKTNADLTTVAIENSIVVYTGIPSHAPRVTTSFSLADRTKITSRPIRMSDWSAFAQAAYGVIKAIRESEVATRTQRPTSEQIKQHVDRMSERGTKPGYRSVPQIQIDRLVRDQPPRKLPRSIRRATASKLAPWLRGIGMFFMLVSGSLSLVIPLATSFQESLIGPVVLGTAFLSGVLFVAVPTWNRWKNLRLLKRGVCVPARITRMKKGSSTIIVDSARFHSYDTTFAYSLHGETYETTNKTYLDQAKRAARVKDSGHSTFVLIAANNPRRLFWIDGLILEGPPQRSATDQSGA
jgi:hypothetical protein